MKTKIYGLGWVGRSMKKLFPDAFIHDPGLGCIDTRTADVAFICVPSPLVGKALDCETIEQVIWNAPEDLIIVRSTAMPGTADKFPDKNIVVQPEYLGETVGHPLFDPVAREFMILGGSPRNRARAIELYQSVYNANVRITEVTAYEAEVIKLSENRAIAFKVAQCQELYDVCEKAGLNYNTIRQAVYADDPRFNLLWTFIFPNARGFNSKCIPKDVYAWASWAESLGYDPEVTNTMLRVNEERYLRSATAV